MTLTSAFGAQLSIIVTFVIAGKHPIEVYIAVCVYSQVIKQHVLFDQPHAVITQQRKAETFCGRPAGF